MISLLIKYKKSILIITLTLFMGSIAYFGFDAYRRSDVTTVAAKVGRAEIPARHLDRLAEEKAQALRNQGIDVDENIFKLVRQQVLQELVRTEILNQAAQQAQLYVSDYEIASLIRALGLGAASGQFNKNAYEIQVRRQLRMTPAEFENQIRRDTMASSFVRTLFSVYKLTPAEIKYAYKTQHGNVKDFDANKKDFASQLLQTKMETAPRAFVDDFNRKVTIENYVRD